ncbi:hypothetical protein [Streptomyces sp. NPDC046859]|uniref:hypothetical protein n=1 Tax=Streptomyces sp. NPDC046859 TaxID=3155734 RepID=UPI0033E9C4A2
MYGHDPLLLIIAIALVALAIGWIQHTRPAIGTAIDLASKVVLALIAVLVFAFSTAKTTPADHAPATPARQTPSAHNSAPCASHAATPAANCD